MMRDRPYMHYRIGQLEAVLERAGDNAEVLDGLSHELGLRKTERAAKLRIRVAERLRLAPATPPKLQRSAEAPSGTPPSSSATPNGPAAANRTPHAEAPRTVEAAAPSTLSDVPASPAASILAAWTALEVLSPRTFRRPEDLAGEDRWAVAKLTGAALPWEAGERSRKNYQLYYQVFLGAIPMDRAAERLMAAFGADEEQRPRPGEKAAIAAILVDRYGVPLAENAASLSSFAWGLPLALGRDFAKLGGWATLETTVTKELEELVRRVDRDGRALPLDQPTIARAHRWLVERLGLPADLVEPPSFALHVFHYYRAKTPPEPALVNSFFLGDLACSAAMAADGKLPPGLARYLGATTLPQPADLLADSGALEAAVAPATMPAARWPAPGGHPLVLLQQAAINLARSELAGGEGLIAVNGPPGTGKTTLLRDLVAACVLDRATAMAAFDDPAAAFTPSGQRVYAGEKASFQLYTLHPSLKGHEVLVASSNNKAVENISRELPSMSAIGRDPAEMAHFRGIADLLQGASHHADEGPSGTNPDAVQSWGLIAAVLGNKANVAAFHKAFWWDEERSFRLYLKAAKGDVVEREIKDPETGQVVERRPPAIVIEERPPSPESAKQAWRAARDRFSALKRDIDQNLAGLEAVRRLCLDLHEARRAVDAAEHQATQLAARQQTAEGERQRAAIQARQARGEHERHIAALEHSRRERPGWTARLFRTAAFRSWNAAHAALASAALIAKEARSSADKQLDHATAAKETAVAALKDVQSRIAQERQRRDALASQVDGHRATLGDRIVDATLFTRNHETLHLTSPWVPDSLHRKREDLFIAALGLHRAFIDAAARQVHHNLSGFMDVLSSGVPPDEGKRKLLGDLWSTFHMAVPVVSTTFASTERMLGALPAGSIGWLLIDEAGQALPQAAVGAISRAKRTVVVGDPRQIQPIVTLPQRLNEEVFRRFKVDPALWAAPAASAQTVADRASRLQGTFNEESGPRRVGIPLLVHRRCQQPMFELFNRIAYGGQMVHASGSPQATLIGTALGPSRWIDVQGQADTKWCPAEGEAVVKILQQLAAGGVSKPDLFIISPFRVVAHELRRRLEQERALFEALGADPRRWTRDHVGTIHTVQGREADAVLLVLGAPNQNQHGARRWAAETPNILNVAISRARQSLYVIGSRNAWTPVGHARELSDLPAQHWPPVDPTLRPAGQDAEVELRHWTTKTNDQTRLRGPTL